MADQPKVQSEGATEQSEQDLDAAIAKLHSAIAQAQDLAGQARTQGDFAKAVHIDTQTAQLVRTLRRLRDKQGEAIVGGAQWKDLNAHLDALNEQAEQAQGKINQAQQTVETVKALVGVAGKILAAL